MAVPFGFSVGDCIAVSLLIKDAVQALDSAHGAAADYQQVIRELWALDRALLEVVSVSQGFETTIELNALSHAARRTADQCRTCIVEFLDKAKGYRRALGSDEGSGSRWRDVKGKLGWAILRGDDLKVFRTEINAHCSAINMLLITASVSLAKLNDKNLQKRLEDTRRTQEEKSDDQMNVLSKLFEMVQGHTNALVAHGDTIKQVAAGMKYFFTLGTELKNLMTRIWTINFRSYNVLIDLQTRIPREFEPCWIQQPLTLTDPLGRVTPIHLELINSWDVLDSVLTARFRNIPGERKIKQKEYALQDRGSMMDIDRNGLFEASFLPGRRVDMSMIFENVVPTGSLCPGCGARTEQDNLVATTCEKCGLWFQRVEEIIEHSRLPKPRPRPKEGNTSNNPSVVSKTDDNSTAPIVTPSSKKRKAEETEGDVEGYIKMFKRVRLLHTKYKPHSQSWTARVTLLPNLHQGRPFPEDTVAYKRCLSRGFQQEVFLPQVDNHSFRTAIDEAFSNALLGRRWEPLVPREKRPYVGRLLDQFGGSSSHISLALATNCTIWHDKEPMPDLYIAMSQGSVSWTEMNCLPPSRLDLEDAWRFDDGLLDGVDYTMNDDSLFSTLSSLLPQSMTDTPPGSPMEENSYLAQDRHRSDGGRTRSRSPPALESCICGYKPTGNLRNQKGNLKRHKKACRILRQSADFKSPINLKPLLCNFPNCGARFMRSDGLRAHQKVRMHIPT